MKRTKSQLARRKAFLASWKSKNPIKRLKETVAQLTKELDETETSRLLARRQLNHCKNVFIKMSRVNGQPLEVRKMLLQLAGDANLILCLTTSHAEFDAEWAGEPSKLERIELTDEERQLMHRKELEA